MDRAPVVAVVAPALAALVLALSAQWRPTSDVAIEALRMGDVGGPHTPLLGPYSRFGWSHPGPLFFWIGAPFQMVMGPRGLLVAAAVINLGCSAVAVVAARRVGGRPAAWALAVCTTLFLFAADPEVLLHPWNPYVATYPLLAFLLCAMATAEGCRWALPVAALAGSLAAQSHLGSAPMVATGTIVALAWALSRRRTDRRPDPDGKGQSRDRTDLGAATGTAWRWWIAATGALVVVVWSGPLIDQIVNDPGNISAIISFAIDDPEAANTLGDSLDVGARLLGLPPAWAGVQETLGQIPIVRPGEPWTLAIVGLMLVGAAGWAWRRRDHLGLRLVVAAAVLWLAALFALTRTVGLFFFYVVRWTWPVGIFVATAVLTATWRAFEDRGGGRLSRVPLQARRVGALGAVVVLVGAGAAAGRTVTGPLPNERQSEAALAVSEGIQARLPTGDYALRWVDPADLGAIPLGVGADLVGNGYDIRFPVSEATQVGEFRTGPPGGRDEILIIVDRSGPDVEAPPGAVPVTSFDALSPSQRRRLDDLEERVRRATRLPPDESVMITSEDRIEELSAAGARVADLVEMRDLQRLGDAYEVFLVPGGG